MKKSRYSEEQVVYALRLAEAGTLVADVCQRIGTAEATFYPWRKKYGGLGVSKVRELRQMREENARLKRPWPSDEVGDRALVCTSVQGRRTEAGRSRPCPPKLRAQADARKYTFARELLL